MSSEQQKEQKGQRRLGWRQTETETERKKETECNELRCFFPSRESVSSSDLVPVYNSLQTRASLRPANCVHLLGRHFKRQLDRFFANFFLIFLPKIIIHSLAWLIVLLVALSLARRLAGKAPRWRTIIKKGRRLLRMRTFEGVPRLVARCSLLVVARLGSATPIGWATSWQDTWRSVRVVWRASSQSRNSSALKLVIKCCGLCSL